MPQFLSQSVYIMISTRNTRKHENMKMTMDWAAIKNSIKCSLSELYLFALPSGYQMALYNDTCTYTELFLFINNLHYFSFD